MHCFAEIRAFLKDKKKALFGEAEKPQADLDPVDEKIVYPGKYYTMEKAQKERRHWVPQREETMMFSVEETKKRKYRQ